MSLNLKNDLLPWVLLVCSIIIGLFIAYFYYQNALKQTNIIFDEESSDIVSVIKERMNHYEQVLESCNALFLVSKQVDRNTWHDFITSQKIPEHFPGIQAIGYQKRTSDKDEFLKDMEELQSNGLLHRDIPSIDSDGYYRYIIFVEPVDKRNLQAYGLDMTKESVRNEGLKRSLDNEQPALTGKVTLVQEITTDKQNGFLLYLPIYQNGKSHNTIEERRQNEMGVTYEAFRMNNFMDGVISHDMTGINLSVFDQSQSDKNIMYNYNKVEHLETNSDVIFTKQIIIDNFGRNWVILFQGYDSLIPGVVKITTYSIVAGSILLGVFLFIISRRMRKINQIKQQSVISARLKEVEHDIQIQGFKKIEILKNEFSTMISHELKTPLVPILGYCEMLADPNMLGDLKPHQSEAITIIYNNLLKLEKLVDDLLTTHGLELNSLRFDKKEIQVLDFMHKVMSTNKVLMRKKNIEFVNSTKDDYIIKSDVDRLQQVFSNLITNAIDFVEKNGKIEIGSHPDNGFTVFYVKDNGKGIPKEQQKNLFKKFYQIDTSTNRVHQGIGLGLSICKGLVEAMGGKIWVESEQGNGATFYFSIPKE